MPRKPSDLIGGDKLELKKLKKQVDELKQDLDILKQCIKLANFKKVELARQLFENPNFKKKRICELLEVSRSNLYESSKAKRSKYIKKNDQEVIMVIKEVGKLGAYCLSKLVMEINKLRKDRGENAWSEKKIKRILTLYANELGDIVPPSLVFMVDSSNLSKK